MKSLDKEKNIGLALGGGAVLGAAHIGVLRALDELGISISYIAGTSIGSLVASLFAFGKDLDKVEDIALDLTWRDVAKISISRLGLFSNSKIRDFLKENIGDVTFDQANIPVAIVATNIANGQKVVLEKGKIADAVMASTCIPGVFQPVEIGGDLLVDGGIIENVPISPLKAMGADFIIAVNLNAKPAARKPENVVDVIINSFHYTMSAAAKRQSSDADILIAPDLSAFNHIDAGQTEELINKGYEETMKVLS